MAAPVQVDPSEVQSIIVDPRDVSDVPKPQPYNASQRGLKAKGTQGEMSDTFGGTLAKDVARVPSALFEAGPAALQAVRHPLEALSGAFHAISQVPVDVWDDITNGRWGKIAARATELALPGAEEEAGAVGAGAHALAESGALAATKGAAVGLGKAAGTLHIGPLVPYGVGAEALGLGWHTGVGVGAGIQLVKGAVKGAKGALAERAIAEAAPATAEDVQLLDGLAQGFGKKSFAKLPPEDQIKVRDLAQRINAQQTEVTPMAPAPTRNVDIGPQPAPGKTIQDLMREELATQRGPAPEPIAPPPTVTKPTGILPTTGVNAPLRPPLASATPIPAEVPPVAPVAATTPSAAPGRIVPPAGFSMAEHKTTYPEAAPRTMLQNEAAMAQKMPAQPEAPTSQYTATGERKSPELRAAEIHNANSEAMADRFASFLKSLGYDAERAAEIPDTRYSATQIGTGQVIPGWKNIADHLGEAEPHDVTIKKILRKLKE